MKLISFAALSFLAITVSAYPRLGAPPQGAGAPSAEHSQGAGAPGVQQPRGAVAQGAGQLPSTRAQDPWQLLGAAAHDPQQPQNTGVRDAEQVRANNGRLLQNYNEELLQNRLDKLGKEYQEKQKVAEEIQDIAKVLEDEMQELGLLLGALKAGPEYDGVFEKYLQKSKEVSEQHGALNDLKDDMESVQSMYDATVEEILSSNETQQ
ncbi:hypothetical protein BASA50_003607 [Batrachochytrium salamandrivorans]|uniref:Uncharacterized protein n=1 Tax=Batrachochytrium salamandrivorans TaxID=1357716 RepID=A0ABQ8FJ57_9FUNG|nr:hypothetical protein BASA60_008061 [Batrachochytrium salamandrivorans]KAH6598569.1 hypothetical protein BASA50_003607 [Batrachochytrium salamandrivorans]KAH6600745.1 hypothetical protein BASA61_002162 [Batrachochytrium salamandrivorans]KAH9246679.1 hypothetical protein BASA81_015774 [Batrachochytrium salamandrivorans]KAH9266566.1 hypothetical protein BASA84_001052 [Batrachochytrium salamandrivorans]